MNNKKRTLLTLRWVYTSNCREVKIALVTLRWVHTSRLLESGCGQDRVGLAAVSWVVVLAVEVLRKLAKV